MNVLPRLLALPAGVLAAALACAATPAVPHLDLDVTLDTQSRRLGVIAEFAAPGEFRFSLHESLTVTAATVSGRPVTLVPARHGGNRREWRVSAPPGAALRIEYSGTLPALDRALGHRGVLGAMPPMADAEGSFLHSGSGWYPRPAALFSYRVSLSLPAAQRGLVAGRLAAEEVPRDASIPYRATFEFTQPADGIDLMTGPYTVREKLVPQRDAPPLRLRTYFYRSLDPLAEAYLEDTRRYIELYSGQIGAYPFTGFSVVASPLPTGFGMPTLTYIGAQVLKLPFIRATSLGHEVLHNWWGNGVYPDYASGNWSEGLTTFMADYFYKERDSPAAASEMRLGWLRDFAAVPAGEHQALAAFRSRSHGAAAAVGYGKAAMVFFMLRDVIGEDAFSRGIRLFWERNKFKVASWDDLRAAFERAAGRPLKPFFDQWLQRAGGPVPAIAEAKVQSVDGNTKLALTLTQTTPPYALRVPVEIVTGNHMETRWVDLDRERQVITLDVDALPDGVRLDPDLRVWRVLDREQQPPILRQWVIARAPRLLIESSEPGAASAAQALAQRLFEVPPQAIDSEQIAQNHEPVLLIGLHHEVDAALARLGLPPRPAQLASRGSAQVWTVQNKMDSAPIAVVSVRDAASITALLRPLPHYGAQSYLVFDGSRALERGIWPAPGRLIPVTRAKAL
ncbi:MAG: M1 family aminopeptidase [Burkholderiales bacterium]|nr:M1 family aminopeptidase [Burkholderiales bacterium]